jgi:hypothetical protein
VAELSALGAIVRDLRPAVWRLYRYEPWGPVNRGQVRHTLPDEEYRVAVARAAEAAAPVEVAPSSDITRCLLVQPWGDLVVPVPGGMSTLGSCVEDSIDDIWSASSQPTSVSLQKRWLDNVLAES